MKIYLAGICLLFALNTRAQENKGKSFQLSGQLKNGANAKLVLQNVGTTIFLDSTTADATGNFRMKGTVKEPGAFMFGIKGSSEFLQFQMENSVITINGDARDLRKATVSGSKDQDLLNAFNKSLAPSDGQLKDIEKAYADASVKRDSAQIKEITDHTIVQWKASRNDQISSFIARHPSSAVSLGLVAEFVNYKYGTAEQADKLLRLVEATPAGKYSRAIRIRAAIDGQLDAQSGKMAPVFVQPDTAGREVSFSGLKGKYILVDFWASWCQPCRAENPNVLQAYEAFKDKNFTVVAISLDTSRPAWIKAIKEDHLPWLQLSDLKGRNAAAQQYGVLSIPANFLIDPSGRIIATDLRGDRLQEKLKELLDR